MQAVVLAAGRGTRLGELTARRSKAMLPVVGRPLVGRVLERLQSARLRRFLVVGGPEDEELADYCAGLALPCVVQRERRGMAHALACAAPLIDGPFLLSACDNLVSGEFVTRLVSILQETDADGVLTLLPMSPERLQHSAAVQLTAEGRVQRIVEKPSLGSVTSDVGAISVYAFAPSILDYLDVPLSPRGEQELQSAIQALIDAGGDVRGIFAPGRRTVTRPADLLALNLHYLDQGLNSETGAEIDTEIDAEVRATLPPDVVLRPPLRIDARVHVGSGCRFGPRVYLEAGCRVGRDVSLRDALVLRGGDVPDGTEAVGTLFS